jgi:hypothetical protein
MPPQGFGALAEQDLPRRFVHDPLRADVLGFRIGAFDRRTGADRLEPALQIGEMIEILPMTLIGHDPGIGRHVGHRIGARQKFPVGEAVVGDRIESIGLRGVTLNRVGDFLGRI